MIIYIFAVEFHSNLGPMLSFSSQIFCIIEIGRLAIIREAWHEVH